MKTMYLNSASSNDAIVRLHNSNKQNLANLKRDVSPLANAALGLAQTAKEMRAHVVATAGNNRNLVYGTQGGPVQSRQLVKMLDNAKNTLNAFASKAQSLDREIDFFSSHHEGLFHGNVAMVPQAHKVDWSTRQIEKIMARTSKLGAEQGPKVSAAVDNLTYAASYTHRNVHSSLGQQVSALNRGFH
jgi:hypothetical protein